MRKFIVHALAAIAIAGAAPAAGAHSPAIDPCVFGYPADATVYADGTPATPLPCVLDFDDETDDELPETGSAA